MRSHNHLAMLDRVITITAVAIICSCFNKAQFESSKRVSLKCIGRLLTCRRETKSLATDYKTGRHLDVFVSL